MLNENNQIVYAYHNLVFLIYVAGCVNTVILQLYFGIYLILMYFFYAFLVRLGITCCAGVGHNKLVAKLVGEKHKPNQQTLLYPYKLNAFMMTIEKLRKIPGMYIKLICVCKVWVLTV